MGMFSSAEAERIAAAVTEVEKTTAGEIVVAEHPASDDYTDVRLWYAAFTSFAAAVVLHLVLPYWEAGVLFGCQLGIGVAVFLLSGQAALLRRLVPSARATQAVARAAQLAFLQYGVFRTRDRTGVLVYLSELEHRVVILGDEGIHARVQDPGWSRWVEQLVLAIKQGRSCDGVCALIAELGTQLSAAAPIQADDTNELPNFVRGPSSRP